MRVKGTEVRGASFDLSSVDGTWSPGSGSADLDLSGLFVLPGLVDAHVHLSADTLDVDTVVDRDRIADRAQAARDRGVFDLLDKGWSDDLVLEMALAHRFEGVRVHAAGVMLHPEDGYWTDFGLVVEGDGLVEACAEIAGRRPWVKVVGDWPRRGQGALPNYSEAVLADAVGAAHERGARVAIHTMAPDVASMAVRAGVDSIEHGLFVTRQDLEMLAARGGVWVPTVLRMHAVLAEMRPGSTGAEVVGRGIDNVRRLLPVAADLGVSVLAGSDLAVGASEIGAEIDALVRMGLPAAAAVAGASFGAHRVLGIEAGLRPGRPAELVAYDRDPLHDPSVMIEPVVVVSKGEVIVDRR